MKPLKSLLLALLPVLFLLSCNPNRVFEKNEDIKGNIWDKDFKTSYTVDIQDTAQHYDVYVNIRHAKFYQYSNLWIMIYTTFPDGKRLSQRVEFELAEKDGKWEGDCMGDICDISLPIQKNAIFNEKGKYTFEFEQIMRADKLPAIMAMGLKIEKTQKAK
jgi:gliding motility-associated lipoprotein GldH